MHNGGYPYFQLLQCKSLKLIEKDFLDLRNTFLNLEYFSQNKRIPLTETTFPVPSARRFDLNRETYISKREQVLLTRKVFLARKYFAFREKCSYSETVFLNKNEAQKGPRKSFRKINFMF